MNPNIKVLTRLVGLVVFMGAMAWAAVPFYDWFCRVTGYGGETAQAVQNTSEISDHVMNVRFDASVERDFPWIFKPVERTTTIRLGETGLAFYEAYNPTDKPIAGTASYNVSPYAAGSYFVKIDCFCFEMQVLAPGERVQMPVTYYIDPEILNDPEGKYAQEITLSYTFHATDLPEDYQISQNQLQSDSNMN